METDVKDRTSALKEFFKDSIGRSPFPQISYISLFENLIKMIGSLSITKE